MIAIKTLWDGKFGLDGNTSVLRWEPSVAKRAALVEDGNGERAGLVEDSDTTSVSQGLTSPSLRLLHHWGVGPSGVVIGYRSGGGLLGLGRLIGRFSKLFY